MCGFINNRERDSYRQCAAVPPGLLGQKALVQGLAQEGGGGGVQQGRGDRLTGALSSLMVLSSVHIATITRLLTKLLPSPVIPTIAHQPQQSGGNTQNRF